MRNHLKTRRVVLVVEMAVQNQKRGIQTWDSSLAEVKKCNVINYVRHEPMKL